MTHPNPPRPAFPHDAAPRTDTAPGVPTGGVNSSSGNGFGPAPHAPHSLAGGGAGPSEAASAALPGPGPGPTPAGPSRLRTAGGAATPPEASAAPVFGPAPAGAPTGRGAAAPHRTARRRPEPGAGERGLRSVRPQPRGAGPRRGTRTPGAGALVVADGAAGLIGLCEVGPDGGPVLPVVLLGVLLAVHRRAGLYRPKLAPAALDEVPQVALGAVLAWGLAAAALAATAPHDALGWTELAYAVALTAASSVAARALAYRLRLRRARREPAAALVLGAGPAAQQVAAALRAHPEYGLRPVGVASVSAPAPHQGLVARQAPRDRDRDRDREAAATLPLPVLSGRADITRAVVQNSVRHAVVVGPSADPVVGLLAGRGCQVWQVGSATRPPHLWGYAVQPVRCGPDARRHVKRAMDIVLAAAALTAVAPVLGGCALAVRLTDGPGVLFRQERIGLDGRPFTVLKFRTLRPHDSDESATRWNIAHDRRMSGVGRLMRRTSLDELPQLWNVLRGDMSLVGPRPERPYFVAEFAAAHPGYEDRHRMPAGITGLAQVHGLRGDTSIADRARFDNHYIDTWSLWQDVAIMLRTAATLFRLGGS